MGSPLSSLLSDVYLRNLEDYEFDEKEEHQEIKKISNSEDGTLDECEYVLKLSSQIYTAESSRPKASTKRKADETNRLENTENSLDGVDPSHFNHKRAKTNVIVNQTKSPSEQDKNDVEDLEMLSDDDITQAEEEERCRLRSFFEKLREDWPESEIGDGFDYNYPRTPCKSFPNCKFADRCLYIHPNCELDALCTRKNCPLTHASRRVIPTSLPSPPPMKPKVNGTRKICRYFPNCRNSQCLYYHPEPCQYGNLCQKQGCLFGHSPAIPSPTQFRWIAPKL